ncbi:MAG TPA: ribonuclease D [Steroidobacteraceae bacterium]|nr:ribonuclease D [Steroidobacteraceae bacterium]
MITSSAALDELAARLESCEHLGLDTEFLRERTYRAQLCLVQISSPGDAVCIDPLAVTELAGLARILAAPAITKVMHASRQDVEVLFPVAGLVRPVFDTQIAAALCGLPAQIGYGELVRRLLSRELPKSHTRTDWSRRPLSAEQIEYALDDVRYLLPLKAILEEQLDRSGRLAWLAEELDELNGSRTIATDPQDAWLRVKGLRGLDPARERLAQCLAAWRESRAIERNKPRGWILDDVALREIVIQVPRTLQALAGIPEIPAGVLKHCGTELLQCVTAAQVPDPPPPLNTRSRPDPVRTALVKKLSALNQTLAVDLGLSPEVLTTRRELEQLADGQRDVAVLRGWRRGVVGERLLAAL